MSGRFLFVCGALLVFANVAFGDGTYQHTKDGKALVWNNHPKAGDEAKWSGDRDREGYASGFGTLTWYIARESETGSAKPALYARYWGNMVRGKFNGPVNSHSKRKTDHAIFADGVQTTRWAAGPAPSQIVAEPAKRFPGAKPQTPNVQRPTEALPPRPAAEEAVAQPGTRSTPNVQRSTSNHSDASREPVDNVRRERSCETRQRRTPKIELRRPNCRNTSRRTIAQSVEGRKRPAPKGFASRQPNAQLRKRPRAGSSASSDQ